LALFIEGKVPHNPLSATQFMVVAMIEVAQLTLYIRQLKAFSRTAQLALVKVSPQQILSLKAQTHP